MWEKVGISGGESHMGNGWEVGQSRKKAEWSSRPEWRAVKGPDWDTEKLHFLTFPCPEFSLQQRFSFAGSHMVFFILTATPFCSL